MTDTSTSGVEKSPANARVVLALCIKRTAQILTVAAALLTLYTEGATAWINTQEAIKVKAAADNAAVRQKAEAELRRQKAAVALETARNAELKEAAEADKVEQSVAYQRKANAVIYRYLH